MTDDVKSIKAEVKNVFATEPFWKSYLLAVTTASLVLLSKMLVLPLLVGSWFESATNNSLETKITHFIGLAILIFTVLWIGAFATAWAPTLVARAVLRRLAKQHIAYVLVSGAITGAVLCMAAVCIPGLGINDQGYELPFSQKYSNAVPSFTLAGLLGSFVYWWCQPRSA